MGIGAICHTVNPRLFPEQIAWIINHAQDRVVMIDITFVPVLEKIADKLPSVERYIVLTDKAHMPQTTLKNAVAYEDWIAEADGKFEWKTFDENTAAAMCYTSGTTGDPEGRAVFAPFQRAARADGQYRRLRSAPTPPTPCCRWCRCSTPTAGASRSPRPRWAPSW